MHNGVSGDPVTCEKIIGIASTPDGTDPVDRAHARVESCGPELPTPEPRVFIERRCC